MTFSTNNIIKTYILQKWSINYLDFFKGLKRYNDCTRKGVILAIIEKEINDFYKNLPKIGIFSLGSTNSNPEIEY